MYYNGITLRGFYMIVEVRYFSKTGNTKKVAEAIAEAYGVKALDVSHPLDQDCDVLFLGGAPYATSLAKPLKEFMLNIGVKVGKVATFSTSALLSNNTLVAKFKKVGAKKNLNVLDDEFNCKGKFLNLHAHRPNEADLKAAKEWALKIAK